VESACGVRQGRHQAAQAQQFFRIGTGGTAGTYYPVGGMIANAVSQPGKIVATAQASNGSLANVTGIAGGAHGIGLQPGRRGHLGLHRHRRLRRQAQDHRPAPDRQPLPRERARGGEEGLGIKTWPTSRASAWRWTNRARAR
jgi:hypothetical protein